MESFLGNIVGVMENVLATVVAYWFTASVWLTCAAVVVWLAWNVSRMMRSK